MIAGRTIVNQEVNGNHYISNSLKNENRDKNDQPRNREDSHKMSDNYIWSVGLSSTFRKMSKEIRMFSCLRSHVITVEGLIGAGKSTAGRSITRYLKSIGLKAKFYSEFVHPPLLEQYIQDMDKYGYSFQIIMVRERLRIYHQAFKDAQKGVISIIDRCILGDIAFAKMLYDKKTINHEEWQIYLSLIKKDKIVEPSLTIYLNCSAKEAFRRMQARSNQAEVNGYTLKYFQELEASYNSVIQEIHPPLRKIDWETPRVTQIFKGNDREISYISDDDCLKILMEIRKGLFDLEE